MTTVSMRRLGAAAAVCALGLAAQVGPTSAAGVRDGKWSDPTGVKYGGVSTVSATAAPLFCVEDLGVDPASPGVPVGSCTAQVDLKLSSCLIFQGQTECTAVADSGQFSYSDTLGWSDGPFSVSGTGSCTTASDGVSTSAFAASVQPQRLYVGAVTCTFAFQGTHLGNAAGVGQAKGSVHFFGKVNPDGTITVLGGSFEGVYNFVGAPTPTPTPLSATV